MKVKIQDLESNPFRDMKNYPINPEKIQSLTNSINQTGFWDNILARKKNGKIQIAYGHHRLIVLQRNFKPDHIVDIPVKNLDDSTMIRIMANENMEQWAINPKIIHETIRVTFEFIKAKHSLKKVLTNRPQPGEAKKATVFIGLSIPKEIKIDFKNGYRKSPLAKQISNWLGKNWNEHRVYYSLDHLKRMEQIQIGDEKIKEEDRLDKEAIESFPHATSAEKFGRSIKKHKLIPEQQKRVAQKIIEKEDFSEEGIEYEILEEKSGLKEKKGEKEREFEVFIAECSKLINSLNRKLETLINFKSDFDSAYYKETFARFSFDASIDLLRVRLKQLLEGDK